MVFIIYQVYTTNEFYFFDFYNFSDNFFSFTEHVCVKNVTIKAEKLQVDFQSNVTLYCYFELEKDEVLLSVMWNRGRHEFFGYRPSYKTLMSTSTAYNIKVDVSTYIIMSTKTNSFINIMDSTNLST